jgi:hypothetical protein
MTRARQATQANGPLVNWRLARDEEKRAMEVMEVLEVMEVMEVIQAICAPRVRASASLAPASSLQPPAFFLATAYSLQPTA